jgi:DNA-binding NarL/FixJ family response regulator
MHALRCRFQSFDECRFQFDYEQTTNTPGATMSAETVSKIAVLSAHRYRAESLAFTLSQHLNLQTVAVVDTATELPSDFEVILIDLDMEAALRLTRNITSKPGHPRVVLLGLVESEESVLRLAEVGAGGYVSANATFSDLISVVESVQRGEFACRPDITYALFSHLAELASSDNQSLLDAAVLTMRERQIFSLLSQRLMNKEIAARLYLSEHTVKNHVHHILKKLGMRNRNLVARYRSSPPAAEDSNLKCAVQ